MRDFIREVMAVEDMEMTRTTVYGQTHQEV
jgi:hypothetical protein